MQIAANSWKHPNLTATHSQGKPGVMREVVAGTMLVVDDKTSAILGQAKLESRGWGRWAGRQLTGSRHKSILDYHVYFPSFAGTDHPGSA